MIIGVRARSPAGRARHEASQVAARPALARVDHEPGRPDGGLGVAVALPKPSQQMPDRVAVQQLTALGGGVLVDGLGDPPLDPCELLVAGGFPPDRAEWIYRRTQELRMQTLQAQYDARREGRPLDPDSQERTLRTELGDADYERYLTAFNRPTSVSVQSVLASSPAERVGLKPGDEIVGYGGQRVFDVRDLNALTLEGTAGESVVVEVRRNGLPLQLVLPRGPLGITGGFDGPPFRIGGPN